RIERIGRVRRPGRRHLRPVDRRVDDRRVRVARAVEVLNMVGAPAERSVVVETDVHARGAEGDGRQDDSRETREQDETDETIHRRSPPSDRNQVTVPRVYDDAVKRRLVGSAEPRRASPLYTTSAVR